MSDPSECDPLIRCQSRTDGHMEQVHSYWDEVIQILKSELGWL